MLKKVIYEAADYIVNHRDECRIGPILLHFAVLRVGLCESGDVIWYLTVTSRKWEQWLKPLGVQNPLLTSFTAHLCEIGKYFSYIKGYESESNKFWNSVVAKKRVFVHIIVHIKFG